MTEKDRELVLADAVSDAIWGGERGWERCTDEQFEALKSRIYTLGRLERKLSEQIGKHLNSAHHLDIIVRDGGRDHRYEFDWVRDILRA